MRSTLTDRCYAFGIEFLTLCLWQGILLVVFGNTNLGHLSDLAALFLLWGAPVSFFILAGASHRATLGMICRDLTIRRRDGGEVSFVWYFLRVLVGIVLIPLVPLSFIVALTVRDGERTLADRVMGTTVCRGDGIKSQNVVPPEFRGVSLIARFGAFMLDTLVAAFLLIVTPGPGIIFLGSIWFTLVFAYLPGAVIGAFWGGTFGMWALGLQFYDKDGSEISYVACLLRNVMDILLLPVMPISLLVAGINRCRQTPADWLFETVVGRKKEWQRESLPRID